MNPSVAVSSTLRIETYTLGLFAVHTYLLWNTQSKHAVVIDTGLNPTAVLEKIQAETLDLKGIFHTHGHIDHVEGQPSIKHCYPGTPSYLSQDDDFWIEHLADQAAMFQMETPSGVKIDHGLKHGDVFSFEGFTLEARHVPGHSPGGICFWVPECHAMFCGDVIFYQSIGRTDFPRGDYDALMEGIHSQILSLPDDVTLYPGHGPATTVGHERANNPFVLRYLAKF